MCYTIVTDSAASLTDSLIEKYNICVIPLCCVANGEQLPGYVKGRDNAAELKTIYDMMRDRLPVSTACLNADDCRTEFESILKSGNDLLYIGFSSTLSASYQVARNVLDELKNKYPERKILCIDSMCGAMGQGKLVTLAAKLKEQGGEIELVYDFAEESKMKICHLFTVDTLSFLYRGGRVKKSAYLLACAFKIKPIMHLDSSGRMMPVGKALGRRPSLNGLVTTMARNIANPEQQTVYIAHADCPEDAEYLAQRIKQTLNVKEVVISCIDLVVGVHTGPGTVGVFYVGDKRQA